MLYAYDEPYVGPSPLAPQGHRALILPHTQHTQPGSCHVWLFSGRK